MKRLRPRCTLATLLALTMPALAHAENEADEPRSERNRIDPDRRDIVVTGTRFIIPALEGIEPEQTYDSDRVATYAVSTIGEAIDEIAAENGDDQPALLVNGEPIQDRGDIEDYPVEAIASIEVLPRGSARRVGGAPGQRAYNIVLKKQVTSATGTYGHKLATDGGWNEEAGELLATHIRGRDRVNLALRTRDSSPLLESKRGIVQPAQTYPYAPLGNILPVPAFGQEIDPVLSALAGKPVALAAVPDGSASPSLADFVPGAGVPNTIDRGRFRSLRQASRTYEATLAGTKQLTQWLSASLNGSLSWNTNRGLSGLPSALFLVSADNVASPFSREVLLARSDDTRPLRSESRSNDRSLSLTLNAGFGRWYASVGLRYDSRLTSYNFDVVDGSTFLGPIALDPQRNPFAPSLGSLISVVSELSGSRLTRNEAQANINGPLFTLPAGDVKFRASLVTGHSHLTPSGTFGGTPFSRSDTTIQAGITVPLTGKEANFLPALGEIELSFDAARTEITDQPSLDRYSWGVNWQVRRWLRFNGGFTRTRRPVDPAFIAEPVTVYENVRTYDPLRDETVDVTFIGGGNPGLRPQTDDVYQLAVSAAPLPRYNLQVQASYTSTRSRDLLGSLPPASPAVLAAFPERFLRDGTGVLRRVDSRVANFAGERRNDLRYSISFTIPLYHVQTPAELAAIERGDVPRTPRHSSRPSIQVNFAHTIVLDDTVRIRDGLPAVDLLAGGAIGIGGGRSRHQISGSIALSDRGTGIRLAGNRVGASRLLVGTFNSANELRFGAITKFDAQVFADTAQLFPGQGWAKGGRISFRLENITNARQRVIDRLGNTPLNYQPAYRDAVGRTIMFEFRKAF